MSGESARARLWMRTRTVRCGSMEADEDEDRLEGGSLGCVRREKIGAVLLDSGGMGSGGTGAGPSELAWSEAKRRRGGKRIMVGGGAGGVVGGGGVARVVEMPADERC